MGWAHKLGANSQKESSRKNSIMGIGPLKNCIPSFAVQISWLQDTECMARKFQSFFCHLILGINHYGGKMRKDGKIFRLF
jgi:hypothetical protein